MLIHQYRPTCLLRVTGEDSAAYLQGQFTNDLRQTKGAAVYGLWLNQKGKVLADSFVLKQAEGEFIVVSITAPAAGIKARLEEYIVADDVTVSEETTQVHGMVISGPGSGEHVHQGVGVVPSAGQFIQQENLLVFAGHRSREDNFELIGSEAQIEAARHKFLAMGGREAGTEEMEFIRISAGLPSVPQDIGPGDLPNEGGLEDGAISFTKGCYLGQEVMARLKNLGQVRRRLRRIHGTGAAPEALTPLYQGERQVGQVRSSARQESEFVALAMLSLVNLDPGADLSLAPNAAPTIRIIPHG